MRRRQGSSSELYHVHAHQGQGHAGPELV